MSVIYPKLSRSYPEQISDLDVGIQENGPKMESKILEIRVLASEKEVLITLHVCLIDNSVKSKCGKTIFSFHFFLQKSCEVC